MGEMSIYLLDKSAINLLMISTGEFLQMKKSNWWCWGKNCWEVCPAP
jgi:hypothetical protein